MSKTISPLEKAFPLLETDLISELEEKAVVRHYGAGETLVKKGQYFKSALIVLEGLVKIYREDEEGNEFFYLLSGAGPGLRLKHGLRLPPGNK